MQDTDNQSVMLIGSHDILNHVFMPQSTSSGRECLPLQVFTGWVHVLSSN